jgi:predicted XRE-type DNA-binding protein
MAKMIGGVEGSGNEFADIGLTNPEERLAKADLGIRIASAIRARRLRQARAARI